MGRSGQEPARRALLYSWPACRPRNGMLVDGDSSRSEGITKQGAAFFVESANDVEVQRTRQVTHV
jgi:hypothetical protein